MAKLWFWGSGWLQKREASRSGAADGALRIPGADWPRDKFPQFEHALQQRAQTQSEAFKERWHDEDNKLHVAYCNAKGDHGRALREISRLEQTRGDLQREYDEEKARVDRLGGPVYLNKTAYLLIMFVLGVLEIPLNAVVMEAFGLDRIQTYLFTLIPAAALLFGAHFIGIATRINVFQRHSLTPVVWLSVVLAALAFIFVVGLSYIREEYLADVGKNLTEIELNPLMLTITFAAVNLLLFGVAVVASALAHNPALEQFVAVRAALRRCVQAIAAARRSVDIAERTVESTRVTKVNTVRRYRAIVEQVRNDAEWLISHYRGANMRVRDDGVRPPPFDTLPVIGNPIPTEGELDFNCERMAVDGAIDARPVAKEEKSVDGHLEERVPSD